MDSEWGKYLITFQFDHLEMVGFNADVKPVHVYNLIMDNLKLREVLKDENATLEYGVQHLAQLN